MNHADYCLFCVECHVLGHDDVWELAKVCHIFVFDDVRFSVVVINAIFIVTSKLYPHTTEVACFQTL